MSISKAFASRERDDFSFSINSDFVVPSMAAAHEFIFAPDANEAMASAAAKAKPVRVDRTPDFLEGAAAGENPVPDYDADLDTLAAYLTDGYWEDNEEARRSFDIEAGGTITVDIATLDKAAQVLARKAFQAWTDATGIRFQEVRNGADIDFTDNYFDTAAAFADSEVDGSQIVRSEVTVSQKWIENLGSGKYDYSMLTYIHEIGHAMGLGHAGNYNGSATYDPNVHADNDSWQASVMSYFDQNENLDVDADKALPLTLMMSDILAIRELYGIVDIRPSDNVYSYETDFKAASSLDGRYRGITARTIVDTSGTDVLDFSWSKKALVIDLHEESFSNINGVKGNLAIARGTIIEGAVGGIKGDTIIGNDYANALYGNSGADTLTGNGGEDFFIFDTKPSTAYADVITDFEIGVDTIGFNNKMFKAVGRDGVLADIAFVVNTTGDAEDRRDRVIYDSASGELFYDANGSRKGGSVLVATLEDTLALDASHLLVI
ncbi:M10 family metallopeptidase [Rhizobium sp. TH2]|uniref:M10 family metallopeptidase n=1 Tax=Rhizobium sp. TH2 TaxID=2775403 RepID=UPI00215798DF|nr:M10 family metallopeptidase [Rhizobium sp. TH2]UVC09503.1 M10 family metallopeptidase [Rhizobium sp. TH2]